MKVRAQALKMLHAGTPPATIRRLVEAGLADKAREVRATVEAVATQLREQGVELAA